MNPRKTGTAMVLAGAATQAVGMLWEAIRRSGASAKSTDLFDLGVAAHALFFAGIAVVVLGAAMMFLGPILYAPGAQPGRRFAQLLAPVVAFAGIAGCASAADRSATPIAVRAANSSGKLAAGAPAASVASPPTTAHVHDHGSIIAGTGVGDSPCEKASVKPASPGEVGDGTGGAASNTDAEGGHGHRGMLKQTPLTTAERKLLITQMQQARSVVAKYPTVAAGEAAGYRQSTVFVPCIGAHYTNMKLVTRFDPAAPSELLFDGTSPDSKIVGLSYLVWHPGGPPEGFAGKNDLFHQHNANGGLCLKGGLVIGGEAMKVSDCEKAGGKKSSKLMADVYMAHAWVAPGWECSWGVFAGECPELGGKLGGTAFDN